MVKLLESAVSFTKDKVTIYMNHYILNESDSDSKSDSDTSCDSDDTGALHSVEQATGNHSKKDKNNSNTEVLASICGIFMNILYLH